MMKWIKPSVSIGILLFFAVGLAACSAGEIKFSPQEVVNTALQEADEPIAFYGEYTLQSNDDESAVKVEQWVAKDGKRRIEMKTADGDLEMISVNDGKTISTYDTTTNTAMIMNMAEKDMQLLNGQTPQQQAKQLLELVKNSHELSTVGDEKIAGRDTFHIIAKAKDAKTLIGDQEIWIDKETWMVLKSISISNQLVLTQEFTKIDYDPVLDKELFIFDIPEGATVEIMDESSYAPQEATMNEVKEELGTFYKVSETVDLKLSDITVMEGLEGRLEFSFDYTDHAGIPAFSVTVFKEMANVTDFGGVSGEEDITIRGRKGTKTESGNFRLLNWKEDGLLYSVILENPTVEFEEVEKQLEEMELVE